MAKVQLCDGRSSLWRYDTGVRIELLDCQNVTECHFAVPDGVISRTVSDGLCSIPDAALHTPGLLRVYAFERNADGGLTRHDFRLLVNDRPKPADYIDPPDEMDNLQALAERVAPLIPGGGGGNLTVDNEGNATISGGFTVDESGNAVL